MAQIAFQMAQNLGHLRPYAWLWSNTRPLGALGVGLSLDPEGRLKVMGSI